MAESIGKYSVEDDIRFAATLPGAFYTDSELFERSREQVFASSWQMIGDASVVKTPGDYHAFTLLKGMLDEPLLLTRDEDDVVHCLSNVCTHRAHIVAPCSGHGKSLRCRYHGRKFKLDGAFLSMPEFDEACNFPSKEDSLPRLLIKTLGPFFFTSLHPRKSFIDTFGPLIERAGYLPFNELRFDDSRSRDYLVDAHWAVYCENYLEGFHIPFVHRSLNEELDYSEYSTELFADGTVQLGVSKNGDTLVNPPGPHTDYGRQLAAYYYFIFPNLMLNLYPWGVSINIVKPLSIKRTRVSFLSYVWNEELFHDGVVQELDRVEREDEEVVERVQMGCSSRLYNRGRFSPRREKGVHHFQKMLLRALNES